MRSNLSLHFFCFQLATPFISSFVSIILKKLVTGSQTQLVGGYKQLPDLALQQVGACSKFVLVVYWDQAQTVTVKQFYLGVHDKPPHFRLSLFPAPVPVGVLETERSRKRRREATTCRDFSHFSRRVRERLFPKHSCDFWCVLYSIRPYYRPHRKCFFDNVCINVGGY